MTTAALTELIPQEAAQGMRAALAREDAVIADALPLMGLLLTRQRDRWLSEELLTRVRAMGQDLVRQVHEASGIGQGAGEAPGPDLTADSEILEHLVALVIEGQLVERLRQQDGVDGVLPPLIQETMAREDQTMAALAMAVLAAQARFLQYFQRMELPLQELPGELFHAVLVAARSGAATAAEAQNADRRLREAYDEAAARLGLVERLVTGLDDITPAFDLDQAGPTVFATALAIATGQDRRRVLMAMGGPQPARLALTLRAAGLERTAIEEQMLRLDSTLALPPELAALNIEDAQSLLDGPDGAGAPE